MTTKQLLKEICYIHLLFSDPSTPHALIPRRPKNKKEKDLIKRYNKDTDVHQVWYKISKEIHDKKHKLLPANKLSNILDKLMLKYPDYIQVSHCDDSMFMSSDLYFITHKAPYAFMGTTVILVTQEGTTAEFFLYPHHMKQLQDQMKLLMSSYKSITKRKKELTKKYKKAFSTITY